MFIGVDEIEATTGLRPTADLLAIAQAQVEVYVGRFDEEVDGEHDRRLLAKATMFQVVHLAQRMEARKHIGKVVSTSEEEQQVEHEEEQSAVMSEWAVKACNKVSWLRSRRVNTIGLYEGRVME